VRADSVRNAAVVRVLTAQSLLLCDVVPSRTAQRHGYPCARVQAGEPFPLFGEVVPGAAPYVPVSTPSAGEVARARPDRY
jgi:hypothetical protein